jgi:hypothetical protein
MAGWMPPTYCSGSGTFTVEHTPKLKVNHVKLKDVIRFPFPTERFAENLLTPKP